MDRLAELVGAFSLVCSVADGFPAEKALRTACAAVALGRRAGLGGDALQDLYYLGALRFSGCTGFALEDTRLNAGDDIGLRRTMAVADVGDPAAFVARVQEGLGAHLPAEGRPAVVGGLLSEPAVAVRHARAQCDAAVSLAGRLGMGPAVARALDQKEERWDGRGIPAGVAGEALSPLVRLYAVADLAEMFGRLGGRARAEEALLQQRGAWLDPAAVDLWRRHADALTDELFAPSPWTRFLAAEPAPRRWLPAPPVVLAEALSRFADLKSRWFLGHAANVAELAAAAAPACGVDPERARLAGLLHDLGRAGVSNLVWDKPGPLDPLEREQAEQHSRLGLQVLRLVPAFAPAAAAVEAQHTRPERAPAEARLLAAADAWCALTSPRPWRAALPADEARALLQREGFDGDCVAAVVAAATGQRARPRHAGGLSPREVEVLRLVAQGLANKEIAGTLGLSPKTVERHVTRLYARIGAGSRAAAALWALDHGLLRS